MREQEIKEILARILKYGILNIRQVKSLDDLKEEVYHLHNLPSIIVNYDEERVKYYYQIERKSYITQCSSEVDLSIFELDWKRLAKLLGEE